MRLPSCVYVLAGCLVVVGCDEPDPAPPAQPHLVDVVTRYIGRDLAKGREDFKPLQDALRQLDPARRPDDVGPYLRARYVWPFAQAEGPSGYLVFEAEMGIVVPGSTAVRLTWIDSSGVINAKSEFDTK